MFSWFRYFLFKKRRNHYLNRMYSARDPWSSALTFEMISHKIKTELGARKFSAALDVGCGEGSYSALLSGFAKAYLGADVSAPALARARSLNPSLRFVQKDFDSLPSLQQKFDLIVFNFALDYLGFQDHPELFTQNLYSFIQGCVQEGAVILIFNPVYKTETWDRLQKYQFLLETFGFATVRRELLSAPDLQIGFLMMEFKTR
jgi:trans-aconitate methyltransferase